MAMPSRISKEVKDVILRVLEFCKEEKMNRRPIIPLVKVNLRVATATGVSLHTVSNIIKQGKIAAENGIKIGGITKKRRPRQDKVTLSNFDMENIKAIIDEYYREHQECPSLKKLLPLVRNQIGYTNSIETLRRILKQMGYSHEKTDKKKWVLREYGSTKLENPTFVSPVMQNSTQINQEMENHMQMNPEIDYQISVCSGAENSPQISTKIEHQTIVNLETNARNFVRGYIIPSVPYNQQDIMHDHDYSKLSMMINKC